MRLRVLFRFRRSHDTGRRCHFPPIWPKNCRDPDTRTKGAIAQEAAKRPWTPCHQEPDIPRAAYEDNAHLQLSAMTRIALMPDLMFDRLNAHG